VQTVVPRGGRAGGGVLLAPILRQVTSAASKLGDGPPSSKRFPRPKNIALQMPSSHMSAVMSRTHRGAGECGQGAADGGALTLLCLHQHGVSAPVRAILHRVRIRLGLRGRAARPDPRHPPLLRWVIVWVVLVQGQNRVDFQPPFARKPPRALCGYQILGLSLSHFT